MTVRELFSPSGLRLIAAGAAALTVFIVGVVGLTQIQRARTLTALVASLSARLGAQERLLTILASPTSRSTALHGSGAGSARLVFDPGTGQGTLVAAGLPDPGPGMVYQVWVVADEPLSAGVFQPIPGQPIVFPVGIDLRHAQAVTISVERGPRGSSSAPASPPAFSGTL